MPKETNWLEERKRADFFIGIDPGVNTGFAIWNKEKRKFDTVSTTTIFKAIDSVIKLYASTPYIFVRIEDARIRTWFGESGPEKWKGAGSIMRDCGIWEEEMEAFGIPYEMVHPKHVKATDAEFFKKISGWGGRTSKHAREAAWMVLNM